ncbi:DUF2683 family protein [Flavobacterium sp. KACC 22763]|uniref:DUF2683 family protein n=1 Tax=Flavobacterium sp. KACC 22763 TaxID=3025668 RepID=UPI0023666B15|nr:DUF2683 family protein [Flavobacterium sp. KACC 22763]WDF62789.1 hypothetical protein PQ463_14300 [Flavobacterium sp. KACC 22763]
MTTIKINERTKTGKAFMEMFEAFFKGLDGIEVVETNEYGQVNEEKSTYNPEFVEMVLKSAKDKKSTEINPNDVWGSLGLK